MQKSRETICHLAEKKLLNSAWAPKWGIQKSTNHLSSGTPSCGQVCTVLLHLGEQSVAMKYHILWAVPTPDSFISLTCLMLSVLGTKRVCMGPGCDTIN